MHWKGIRRYFSVLFLPLLLSFITFWLQHTGLLHGFEMMALETFQLVGKQRSQAAPNQIRIIDITDQYHEDHFNGRYPLEAKGVKELLLAIARGKPKLIAVDLDTSHWLPKDLDGLPTSVPIVWARDAFIDEKHRLCVREVLGNAKGVDDVDVGVAVFPKDMDGIIRRYRRFVKGYEHCESAKPDEHTFQTFPWVVANHASHALAQETVRSDSDLVLNYFGDNYALQMISAEDILRSSAGDDFAAHGAVTGQIVLLGGSFHAAHDGHTTPIGILNGVQITAQAIDSELNNGGLHQTDELLMYLFEFIIGIALVFINRAQRIRKASLLVGAAVFMTLAFTSSYMVFSSLALWPNFIPITFAVLVHEIYHQSKENQRLKKQLIGRDQPVLKAPVPTPG